MFNSVAVQIEIVQFGKHQNVGNQDVVIAQFHIFDVFEIFEVVADHIGEAQTLSIDFGDSLRVFPVGHLEELPRVQHLAAVHNPSDFGIRSPENGHDPFLLDLTYGDRCR